MEDLNWCH